MANILELKKTSIKYMEKKNKDTGTIRYKP